jgi:AbiV family abortive infection protein
MGKPKGKPQPEPEIIKATTARAYWQALMDNTTALIEDAARLSGPSPARARSLLILAKEELGKAHGVYQLAETAWTTGEPTVELSPRFVKMERSHPPKIVQSLDFGSELGRFWGNYSFLDEYEGMTLDEMVEHALSKEADYTTSAKELNLQKQAGFYVDRSGDDIKSPLTTTVEDLEEDIQRTAAVAEMLLITDHSRMKLYTPDDYESTHDLQLRLLTISHPEDFSTGEGAAADAEE